MIQKVIALTETGLYRPQNQDAVLAVYTEHVGLFAVADGMGGHYGGERASQTAVESLEIWWNEIRNCALSLSFTEIIADLERKIKEINKDIFQMYHDIGQIGGTTLCLLFVYNNSYAVLNVGDSRLYRCQGWTCTQMTRDDTWENQAHILGSIDMETIRNNMSCGKLVRALGVKKELELSVHTGVLKKRTRFALCSDGIYKYCDKAYLSLQLKSFLWRKDIDRTVRRIRGRVYENGAEDNLSIIVVSATADKKRENQWQL